MNTEAIRDEVRTKLGNYTNTFVKGCTWKLFWEIFDNCHIGQMFTLPLSFGTPVEAS